MKKQLFTLVLFCFSFTLFAAEASKKTLPLYPGCPSLDHDARFYVNHRKATVPKKLYFIISKDHWEAIQSFSSSRKIGAPFVHGAYPQDPTAFSWNEISLLNLQDTDQYDPFGSDKWCVKLVTLNQAYVLVTRFKERDKKQHIIVEVTTENLVGIFTPECLNQDFFGERVYQKELLFYFYQDSFVRNSLPLRSITQSITFKDPLDDEDEWVHVPTKT